MFRKALFVPVHTCMYLCCTSTYSHRSLSHFISRAIQAPSGFLPHTISYVTYDIVCLDIRYRMSGVGCRIPYRIYDIVYTILHCWTYDIVCTISYVFTISYVNMRYRMYDIRYHTTQLIHNVYDIVCV